MRIHKFVTIFSDTLKKDVSQEILFILLRLHNLLLIEIITSSVMWILRARAGNFILFLASHIFSEAKTVYSPEMYSGVWQIITNSLKTYYKIIFNNQNY